MRLRRRNVLVLTLLVLGAASLGEAARIHAKAWLGQRLIARAWQKMQGGEEAARPWPWADTWPVARLEVPAHGVDLLVLAGSTGRTLAWGPGHLVGTAPVGAPGNAVVGGHRDTHFSFLRVLEVGTRIRTEDVAGRVQVYRVAESFVTHDRDARVLAPTEDAQLTLVTCWPFDAPIPGGPQRYVVVAEEVAAGGSSARLPRRRRRAPDGSSRARESSRWQHGSGAPPRSLRRRGRERRRLPCWCCVKCGKTERKPVVYGHPDPGAMERAEEQGTDEGERE